MRRRVIELYDGRVVRDEAAGLYATDESTERVRRPRAHRARRRLRRPRRQRRQRRRPLGAERWLDSHSSSGGLPGAAPQRRPDDRRDRDDRGHRAPARRPHPGSQTTSGQDRGRPRPARARRSSSSTTRPTARSTPSQQRIEGIPHVDGVEYVSPGGGPLACSRTSSRTRACSTSSTPTRCRRLQRQARRPRQPRVRPRGALAPDASGKPQPISAVIDDIVDARGDAADPRGHRRPEDRA